MRPTAQQPNSPTASEFSESRKAESLVEVSGNETGSGRFLWVLILLGLVLAATAALKWQLLLTDPFADLKTGIARPLLWLAVLAETVLLLVLISPWISKSMKGSALFVFFSVAALFAGYRFVTGQKSCGCSGSLEIAPVWFFLFDLSVIAILLVFRNQWRLASWPRWLFAVPERIGYSVGLGGILALLVIVQTDSVSAWIGRHFQGRTIVSRPIELEGLEVGELTECEVELKNWGDFPCQIVGVNKSCRCVVLDDVGWTKIPAKGSLAVALAVRPKRSGPFHQRLLFFLDSRQQYVVAADIFGFVQEQENEQ